MHIPRSLTATLASMPLLFTAIAPAALAQDEEAVPPPLAYSTGTGGAPAEVVQASVEPGMRVDSDGSLVLTAQSRGLGFNDIPVEFGDARLSGLLTISANGARQDFADGFANLELRTYRIVNDDGAWAGPGEFIIAQESDSGPALMRQSSMVLTGEGAYDGLVAYVLFHATDEDPTTTVMEGVILAVDLPPAPEPIPAE